MPSQKSSKDFTEFPSPTTHLNLQPVDFNHRFVAISTDVEVGSNSTAGIAYFELQMMVLQSLMYINAYNCWTGKRQNRKNLDQPLYNKAQPWEMT